jgi:hypothetical protein
MASSIGTLLDRFQGFFSKSYFIGGFLPVVLFLFANYALYAATFPAGSPFLLEFIESDLSEKVVFGAVLLLLVFGLGLIVTSLNPWFRQFMAGYYLPTRMSEWLTKRQSKGYEILNGKKQKLLPEVFRFRRALQGSPSWEQQLREARQRGDTKAAVPLRNDPLLQKISSSLVPLEVLQNNWEPIAFASLESLLPDLIRALETRPAAKIRELDELHIKLLALLAYAADRIEVSYRLASAELALRFPKDRSRIGPTQLANLGEVHREYALIRYGLDVEKHWLKISKFVNQDIDFQPVLEDAKAQLDFSVAIAALSLVTTLIWVPLTLRFSASLYFSLAIAAFGLSLTLLFYLLVVQNYRTFTEAARSAVDLYHFDLIRALHLPLPRTPGEERALWEQFEQNNPQLPYQHDESPAEETPQPKNLWQRLVDHFRAWF